MSAPGPITLAVGNGLGFTVAVSGTGPFNFQWYRGATPVGTNSPPFSIPAVQESDGGSYTVAVPNAHGNASSAPALVTVNGALNVENNTELTTIDFPDLETVGGAFDAYGNFSK